jgi:hypothetical protein
MAAADDARLEALRAQLLAPDSGDQAKLAALRAIRESADDPRTHEILKAAAEAPFNAPVLALIVRSFGYLGGPAVASDLARFARSADPAVVSNAVRAAAARSAAEAVQIALPALRGTNAQAAAAAAVCLAERCRTEMNPVMRELLRCRSPVDRLAAQTYLRALPPEAAADAIGEGLAHETDPELFGSLCQLAGRVITRDRSPGLARLREILDGQVSSLRAVRDGLSETLPPEPPPAALASGRAMRSARAVRDRRVDAVAPDAVIEQIRACLTTDGATEQARLQALRELIEHAGDPRARVVLQAAAAHPANGPLLHVVVRSFGYLDDASAAEDLAPFTRHSDVSVASSAIRAVAALDANAALELAVPILRSKRTDVAAAAALALIERCRERADRALLPLASSNDPVDRLAALTYLRALPPAEASPHVVKLIGEETDPDLFEVELRVAARMLRVSDANRLDEIATRLAARVATLTHLLDGLPGSTAASAPERASVPTRRTDDAPAPGASTAPPPVTSARHAPTADPPSPAVAVASPPAGASGPADLRNCLERLPMPAGSTAEPLGSMLLRQAMLPRPVRWLLASTGVASVIGMGVLLRLPDEPRRPPAQAAAQLTVHALGSLGQALASQGEVLAITPERRTLILRAPDDTTLMAVFTDVAPLKALKVRQRVNVTGIIREIRGSQLLVIEGRTVAHVAP